MRTAVVLFGLFAFLSSASATYLEAYQASVQELFPDIRVRLEGDWTEDELSRLRQALDAEILSSRRKAEFSVFNLTWRHHLVFKKGLELKKVIEESDRIRNPAAVWGGGVSGFITHIFEIPHTASVEEIGLFLNENLPEIVDRDPKKLEEYRRMVANAQRGSWCSGLLDFLGFR